MGGNKSGHGRAGGKKNQGVQGGGEGGKRILPELRAGAGKSKQLGLPELGNYSQKMQKFVNKQKKRFGGGQPAEKKRKLEDGVTVQGNTKGQMAALMLNARHTNSHFESRQDFLEQQQDKEEANGGLSVNRSRENSKRRFWKEFQKVVKVSDVLLEVLDARDPLGCRLTDIEKNVESEYGGKKKIVLILNKVDLVPKENILKWLEYLRVEGIPVVPFCAAGGGKSAAQETSSTKSHEDPTHRCVHNLFETLRQFQRTEAGGRKRITVGIVGFPNVGKSSIINALKRERVVGVGNTPGVTTSAQEIHLQGHVKVVDCPGVVLTERNDAETALRNAIKIEHIDDVERPVELIAERCGYIRLQAVYNLPRPCPTFDMFVKLLAEKKGKLLKGGKPNIEEACKVVLKDWNDGRIHFYTTPPEDRDFMVPMGETLNEESGQTATETTVLNTLSSRAKDFICLTSSKPHTTYMVDDDAISRKRKVDDDDGDDTYGEQGGEFNPFQMYKNESAAGHMGAIEGGGIEEGSDEELPDEDAGEPSSEEDMEEEDSNQPEKKTKKKSARKILQDIRKRKQAGVVRRRMLKAKKN